MLHNDNNIRDNTVRYSRGIIAGCFNYDDIYSSLTILSSLNGIFSINSETGKLALTVRKGDTVVCIDSNQSYVNIIGKSDSEDDWVEIGSLYTDEELELISKYNPNIISVDGSQ
jgi:hypothetical protein